MTEVKRAASGSSFSLSTSKKKPSSFSNNEVSSSSTSFKHIYDDVFASSSLRFSDQASSTMDLLPMLTEFVRKKLWEMLKKATAEVFKFLTSAFKLVTGLPKQIDKTEEHLQRIYNYRRDYEYLASNDQVRRDLAIIGPIKSSLQGAIERYDELLRPRNRLLDEACRSNVLTKMKKYSELIVLYVKQVMQLYDIASTVAREEGALQDVQWEPSSNTFRPAKDPRRLPDYDDEYFHVGLDDHVKKVVDLLNLNWESDEAQKKIMDFMVAVVGEAGIGKTTLAQKVYDKVKSQFQLCAWVTVSQTYKPKAVLKDILTKFGASQTQLKELENLAGDDIFEQCRRYLQEALKGKMNVDTEANANANPDGSESSSASYAGEGYSNYIVVLDDVWDTQLSPLIKALTRGDCGRKKWGRILITTRKEKDVVNSWKKSFDVKVHRHEPLSEENAMIIISRKIRRKFSSGEQIVIPDTLREMLKNIPRLPLTILAIGGLLFNKEHREWSEVCHNLGCHLKAYANDDYVRTKTILLYSYDDLHKNELRDCFLYFGMFPEDHEIEVGKLIRIWVAEGFIEDGSGFTPEKVARDYLDELQDRGLVMFASYKTSSFLPTENQLFKMSVKVHDILHEIIRDKFNELKFGQVLNLKSRSSGIERRLPRLSVDNISGTVQYNDTDRNRSNVCISSIMLNKCENVLDSLLTLSPEVTKGLRVLHLKKSDVVDKIPDEVGNLSNLRLLKLRIRNIEKLPEFTSHLSNLETLHIGNRSIRWKVRLPEGLKHLSKLKHLCLNLYVQIPLEVLKWLTQLQTLGPLDVSKKELIGELRSLKSLRKLHVHQLMHDDVTEFFWALKDMSMLRSLRVRVNYLDQKPWSLINTESLKKIVPTLEELVLIADLGTRLPLWFSRLDSLVCLSFEFGYDMEDRPLEVLGKLPHLEKLIMRVDHCASLNFGGESAFKKLRLLVIRCPCSLMKISGCLSSLTKLHLSAFEKLVPIDSHIKEKTEFHHY